MSQKRRHIAPSIKKIINHVHVPGVEYNVADPVPGVPMPLEDPWGQMQITVLN